MKKYLILILFLFGVFRLSAQEYQTAISVHDPVMIRQHNRYYLFSTGWGINVWSSADRKSWKKEQPVFSKAPEWAVKAIPEFKGHIWAPDIYFHEGKYYLYYSVSAFGKNTSAIGVATNATLDPDSPDFNWTDHGKVIQSFPGKTNWNAIDPNVISDEKGMPWMVFGSFWDGIKLAQLSKDLLHISAQADDIPTIASRKKVPGAPNPPAVAGNPVDAGGNAIEAPFLFKKSGYYYLFASIDYCCKGEKSTYKMIVGRSRSIKGPYLDQNGIAMTKGGGTLVLEGDAGWYGVGHNAVCSFDGIDYLIFHGYDAKDRGVPKLRIEKLNWLNEWPLVVEK
ncbi:ABC transporter substrate-binding protein [Pedobacter cryoconitis]|uniref:ABC transporter substrate-binding protein n=1 Tax=Pedobacter cryoconitis TaxID=188932 RepID=A0A127V8D6_9SPHI|nr:arabinan endo-1,5-alpha-L-arabinosidase [Pedobacter cryoconitis]AMP97576.1 ABC transporter substrate-binding protein [Pedobacter cryoconitis]